MKRVKRLDKAKIKSKGNHEYNHEINENNIIKFDNKSNFDFSDISEFLSK
jgi:hypothetical protein